MTAKRPKIVPPELCRFPFADGRHCRMVRQKDHPSLCPHHAREEQQLLEFPRIGEELAATLTGNFLTASDVNHVLGKVFTAVAQGRLPHRTALTLAYIGKLMLASLPAVKDETHFEYSYEAWQEMIGNAIQLSKAAWPGLRPHSQITAENAASELAPSGRRATKPPAWHEDRSARPDGGRDAAARSPSTATPGDPKNN